MIFEFGVCVYFQMFLTSPIRQKLKKSFSGIAALYKTMYQNVYELQTFFSKPVISRYFPHVSLFKRPIIEFGYEGHTMTMTSSYESSRQWLETAQFDFILEHIEAFFEPIFDSLSLFEHNVDTYSRELRTAFSEANKAMVMYTERDKINSEFLK